MAVATDSHRDFLIPEQRAAWRPLPDNGRILRPDDLRLFFCTLIIT